MGIRDPDGNVLVFATKRPDTKVAEQESLIRTLQRLHPFAFGSGNATGLSAAESVMASLEIHG